MAPRLKKLAGKCTRDPSPEQVGQSRFLNLSALKEIQLGDEMAQEVDELLSMGSWQRLLSIREPAILMFTLEVLASFEID